MTIEGTVRTGQAGTDGRGASPETIGGARRRSRAAHAEQSPVNPLVPDRSRIGALLTVSPWTRGLTAAQLDRVLAETTLQTVAAGGYVCRWGEPVTHWIGVADGLVKLSLVSAQGRETSFIGASRGGWFSEGSLLSEAPRRYDGVAVRDSTIACIPRATFHWLLDSSLVFNRAVLVQLSERLFQTLDLVASDRLFEPDARVAYGLAALYHPRLNPMAEKTLAISQEEIGRLVGLSRQRVNHALKTLELRGLLRTGSSGVTVPDPERLTQFLR